jgi:hypothetical protein
MPKTTAQEAYRQPPPLVDMKKRAKSHLATTSFGREGIFFEGEPQQYVTTQQRDFRKWERGKLQIPACVVMERTGFQRGLEGSFDLYSRPDPPIRPNEMEKMRIRDPLHYFNAKVDANPYISVSQLFYRPPVRNAAIRKRPG